ncbi:RDD family protein [Streptomyces sp. NPDC006296]|uniref:RDD family protein n=1 Tax=Streptomyces sp. NPDC006296 TaxID=3156746 RepID=UPI0033A1B72B
MNELVTGDAVVLGLQPARLPSRALAITIDLAVLLAVFVVLSLGIAVASATLDDAATAAITVASFLLVLVGGPVAVETLTHGRSLGKLACGLRVVRDDGGPIRFRHALVRGAMGAVEILGTFGVVGSIASLVSARGRRLGDVFAGTLVVRERVPAGRAPGTPPPPPWLAGRFAQLDLSGVPDGLWLAVRQYLTRMNQLDAAVREAMAARLATDLAACTGAPVPQGVPAAAYLAAVVNERQVRDVRRVAAASGRGGQDAAPRLVPGDEKGLADRSPESRRDEPGPPGTGRGGTVITGRDQDAAGFGNGAGAGDRAGGGAAGAGAEVRTATGFAPPA